VSIVNSDERKVQGSTNDNVVLILDLEYWFS